jgi:hypothetical protein
LGAGDKQAMTAKDGPKGLAAARSRSYKHREP